MLSAGMTSKQNVVFRYVTRLMFHIPDATIHTYPAGHGFNCDERHDYAPESAALAWERTTAFLKEQLR